FPTPLGITALPNLYVTGCIQAGRPDAGSAAEITRSAKSHRAAVASPLIVTTPTGTEISTGVGGTVPTRLGRCPIFGGVTDTSSSQEVGSTTVQGFVAVSTANAPVTIW